VASIRCRDLWRASARAGQDGTVAIGRRHGQTKERCVLDDEPTAIAWVVETDATGFGRMVSGWRAGFSLADHGASTAVTAHSSFTPNSPLIRVLLPVVRRRFHHAQRTILHELKRSLEAAH
jgi:hypothetical protein